MKRSVAYGAGFAVLLAAAPAWAERVPVQDNVQILPSLPLEDVITVTPTVGTDINVGGSFLKGGSNPVAGAGTLFNQTISGATIFNSNSKSFSDTYNQPVQFGVNINYGLSNFDEAYLGFRWFRAEANQFALMTSSNAVTWGGQPIAAGSKVYGKFNDYDEVGIEAGYHHFFDIEEMPGFHPYGGLLLGMKRTGNTQLKLMNSNGNTIASDIHFYNAGLIGDAGVTFGFRYDLGQSIALGLESGLRYEGPLNPNKTDFIGTGFAGMNSAGDRWDIPALASLTAKF